MLNIQSDLIVFSHLKWKYFFEKSESLLSFATEGRRIYFFEAPVLKDQKEASYESQGFGGQIKVIMPVLPLNLHPELVPFTMITLIDRFLIDESIGECIFWYNTPAALLFTQHLNPSRIIYDCLDRSTFLQDAPKELMDLEAELLQKADLVFINKDENKTLASNVKNP